MRIGLVALALCAAACSAPAVDQGACTYGAPRQCFDGRDNSNRGNREDLADRTRPVAVSAIDVTSRTDRDDVANRTRGRVESVLDVTKRADRDDLTIRPKGVALSALDATDRRNRDDATDRTLACP